MCYGDTPPSSNDPQFDIILSKYYPAKMLEVVNYRSLKETVCHNWSQLNGLSLTECFRMILAVLRKWKFFGAYIKMARMKMPSDRKIFIALTDEGIHLLTDKQLVSFQVLSGIWNLFYSHIIDRFNSRIFINSVNVADSRRICYPNIRLCYTPGMTIFM